MVRLFYYPPIDVLLHFPLANFVLLLYIFTFATYVAAAMFKIDEIWSNDRLG